MTVAIINIIKIQFQMGGINQIGKEVVAFHFCLRWNEMKWNSLFYIGQKLHRLKPGIN